MSKFPPPADAAYVRDGDMYRATEKDQPAQSPPSDTLTASNMEEITAETLLHIESLVSWLTAVDFLIFYGLQFEGIKDPGCWPWSTDKPYRDPCRGKIPYPDEAGFCLSLLTLTIAVVRAYTHRLSYLPRLASIFYDYLLLVLWFVVGVALLLNLDCPSMKVGLFGYVAVSQSIYVLPMFYTVRAGISIMRLSLDRIIGCTPEDIEPGYYGRVALDDGEDKDVYVLSRFV